MLYSITVQKCLIQTLDHNFTYYSSTLCGKPCRTYSCQMGYDICLRAITDRVHFDNRDVVDRQFGKYGRTMNINKQSTSDWHLTYTFPWALTLDMIRMRNLYCFMYRQHAWLRKGEVIVRKWIWWYRIEKDTMILIWKEGYNDIETKDTIKLKEGYNDIEMKRTQWHWNAKKES